ncbi:hypothetical protein NVP1161O_074 [Vibrio phage 1.161.O._10N.261.48.C5]|nr:hypothetical protein NVP1161O_074 [Vibrio phage 1.161.O._10N.261.48.C5]
MDKQIPQVLIVGDVTDNFLAAYTQLQIMEANGEVEIIYQEIDESDYEGLKSTEVYSETLEDDFGNIWLDSLHDLVDTGLLDRKHSHPHWHKGRWYYKGEGECIKIRMVIFYMKVKL